MSKKEPRTVSHTVDDHRFGAMHDHAHDEDADHDHDDIDPGPLEDNPIWQRDNVALTSVGIDIGSAGTQVVFSNIHLQRLGSSLGSRYTVVDRKTVFESPVTFTPYADEATIDGPTLGKMIDDAYAQAAIRPSDIDTGVVILTGEALRRGNAQAIAQIIAERGGDFITATAGNHMEAMLAAYGSGAAKASHDRHARILNIDIGGGTAKLALTDHGNVLWTAALHIGGRLIATENEVVVRLDPAGRHHAAAAGLLIDLGDRLIEAQKENIAESMVGLLVRAVTGRAAEPDVAQLFLTEMPGSLDDLDGVMFSGGVGEFVAAKEDRDFGDLGRVLGRAIRRRALNGEFGAALVPAAACIRATALGASEYSVQLSGQTSTITAPGKILPRRNMQVLKPDVVLTENVEASVIADAIAAHFVAFDLDPATSDVALMFDYALAPDYANIRKLADGIVAGMAPQIAADRPLYVMINGDIAQTLGSILRDELSIANELLVLDGIILRDFDYIDLGKIRLPSYTVPVTVKSLVFSDDPRGAERIHFREPEHHHHHSHGHHLHDHHDGHGHTHSHQHEAKRSYEVSPDDEL